MTAVLSISGITRRFLHQQLRDPAALTLLLLVPFVFATVLGFVDQYAGQVLAVGVVAPRDGVLAEGLVDAIDNSEALQAVRFDSTDDLIRAVRVGKVVAGVEVPSDYDDKLLGGERSKVAVFGRAGENASVAAKAGAVLVVSQYEITVGAEIDADGGSDAGSVAGAVASRLEANRAAPPVESLRARRGSSPFGFGRYTAGMLLTFMFVVAMWHAAVLSDDRHRGIMARMSVTPNSGWVLGVGEVAGRVMLSLLQALVMIVVGVVVFGINWGNPLALGLVVFFFVMAATGAGLLVGAVGRPVNKSEMLVRTGGIAPGLALLGGCFWPLVVGPAWLQRVAHITPHAWANDAFGQLLTTSAGVPQVLVPLVVLAGFAFGLFALGLLVLRRSLRG